MPYILQHVPGVYFSKEKKVTYQNQNDKIKEHC